jgi:hypothetical protein
VLNLKLKVSVARTARELVGLWHLIGRYSNQNLLMTVGGGVRKGCRDSPVTAAQRIVRARAVQA